MAKTQIKPAYHGGNIQAAALKYGYQPHEFLDFSANISWVGLPPGMEGAIRRGLSQIAHYPDPNYRSLVQDIAQAVNLPVDHLLVGNGSIELIYTFARSLGNKKALITEPTFSEYKRAVALAGGSVEVFPLFADDNWQVDFTKLTKRLPELDVVFLCNPNNPTGQFIPQDQLVAFLQEAGRYNVIVAVDEAFTDFVEDFTDKSWGVLNLVTQLDNLIVFRSFTKFFAIPGLRLGFCAANSKLIQQIAWAQEPWTVNCIAESVGRLIVASDLADYRAEVRERIKHARKEFSLALAELGLKTWGQANYLLVDLGKTKDSTAVTTALGQKGILVRNCRPFGQRFKRYVRVAVRSPEENALLVTKLAAVLKGEDA